MHATLLFLALSAPPQAPTPPQAPPVRVAPAPAPAPKPEACPCSSACTCGCVEGARCTCGNVAAAPPTASWYVNRVRRGDCWRYEVSQYPDRATDGPFASRLKAQDWADHLEKQADYMTRAPSVIHHSPVAMHQPAALMHERPRLYAQAPAFYSAPTAQPWHASPAPVVLYRQPTWGGGGGVRCVGGG